MVMFQPPRSHARVAVLVCIRLYRYLIVARIHIHRTKGIKAKYESMASSEKEQKCDVIKSGDRRSAKHRGCSVNFHC